MGDFDGCCPHHGKEASNRVIKNEVFILKSLPIDGAPSRAVVVEEVTSLDHEVLTHAMEGAPFVSSWLPFHPELASTELPALKIRRSLFDSGEWLLPKVLRCARDDICEEFNLDVSHVGLDLDHRVLLCLHSIPRRK